MNINVVVIGNRSSDICKRLSTDFDYTLISSKSTDVIYGEFKKKIGLNKSYLIDGYPNDINQAIILDQMINVPVIIWLTPSKCSDSLKDWYGDRIVEIDSTDIESIYKEIVDTMFETVKEPRDISDII